MSAKVGSIMAEVDADVISLMIEYSRIALIAYEHILTFPAEVAHVWKKKKWTAPTWLLMLNRYLLACYVLIEIGQWTPKNCAPLSIVGLVANYVQTVVSAAFSALRVYALLRHQDRFHALSISVLALGLVSIPINLYVNSTSSWMFLEQMGWTSCVEVIVIDEKAYLYLQIASSGSAICQELIVIAVTLYKLWGNVKESHKLLGPRTLSRVLLEGGVVYLSLMLLLDLAQVLEIPPTAPILYYMSTLSFPLQPIIISRFLLGLREVNAPSDSYSSELPGATYTHFRVPTILLESVPIGNMGETLEDHGADGWCQVCAEETQTRSGSSTPELYATDLVLCELM